MSQPLMQISRTFLLLAGLTLGGGAVAAWLFSTGQTDRGPHNGFQEKYYMSDGEIVALPQSEVQWREQLSPEQYYVLRRKGTERAFTGEYWNNKTPGVYRCAGCGLPLFHSAAKYDSGTGWPSFFAPADEESVATRSDNTFFMRRTEVLCSRCGGHLGHVFPDGPGPTGMRYCVNSAALEFTEEQRPADSESDAGS